jgi:hypothetical protein
LRSHFGLPMPAYLPNSRAWYESYAGWSYRYGHMTWYKLRISLLQYLHSVLSELEQMLRAWQERGLLGGTRFNQDDLTAMFSRRTSDLIQELFAVRVSFDDNIHRHLNKFLRLLLSLRKDVLADAAVRQTGRIAAVTRT